MESNAGEKGSTSGRNPKSSKGRKAEHAEKMLIGEKGI